MASAAVASNVTPDKNKNETIIAVRTLLICVFTLSPFSRRFNTRDLDRGAARMSECLKRRLGTIGELLFARTESVQPSVAFKRVL